jgi:hypothetical protein
MTDPRENGFEDIRVATNGHEDILWQPLEPEW